MAPKQIINKTAETTQAWVIGFGILSALISWGNFANDAGGTGVIFALATVLLFVIAANIKTTYDRVGSVTQREFQKKEPECGGYYLLGIACALIAWGCFANNAIGIGLLFVGGTALLFYIPSQLKATYVNTRNRQTTIYK